MLCAAVMLCVFLGGDSTYELWIFRSFMVFPFSMKNLSGKSTAYEGVRVPSIFSQVHGCDASRLEDWDDWGQGKAGCGVGLWVFSPRLQ